MTRDEFVALLTRLAGAWSERDYEKAAGFFAPGIRYADPQHYRFSTRDELLEFFRDDGGYTQSTVWHHILFDEASQIGAAEYTYEGTHRYHGIALIKISGAVVTHWREYQHISDLDWKEFCSGTTF